MMIAARRGHAQAIQQMVRQRANVKYARPGGTTALMDSAAIGDHASIRVLLLASADLAAADEDGMTALMHACKAGHEEAMLPLLQHGADVSSVDRVSRSALSHSPTKKVARRLLEAGADAAQLSDAFCVELGLTRTDAHLEETKGQATSMGGGVEKKRRLSVSHANGLALKRGVQSKRAPPPDLFAVAPPSLSGRPPDPTQDVVRPKFVMAIDPPGDTVGNALAALALVPYVAMATPLLKLTPQNASPEMASAVAILQKAYRKLLKRARIDAKEAFWKPKGSKGYRPEQLKRDSTEAFLKLIEDAKQHARR